MSNIRSFKRSIKKAQYNAYVKGVKAKKKNGWMNKLFGKKK